MNGMKRLVLASASPTRKEFLSRFNYPVEVIPSNYEEDMTLDLAPEDLAVKLSAGKAEDVASKEKNAVIIGIDTFGIFNGELLGKPQTAARAKEMLKSLSGQSHDMVSGITIVDTDSGKRLSDTTKATVRFRELTDKEIDAYVATGEPLNKAAAYASLERGGIFVESVEGDFYTIAGLPVSKLAQMLKQFGISLL